MKSSLLPAFALMLLALSGEGRADNLSPSEIPEVRIDYAFEGRGPGTATVWFSEGGERAAAREQRDLLGHEDYVNYWDGAQMIIQARPGAQPATNPHRAEILQPLTPAFGTESDRKAMGWAPADEQREIAGQTCDLWRQAVFANEICIWRGLTLLWASGVKADGSAKNKREAVEITLGEPIPEEITTLTP